MRASQAGLLLAFSPLSPSSMTDSHMYISTCTYGPNCREIFFFPSLVIFVLLFYYTTVEKADERIPSRLIFFYIYLVMILDFFYRSVFSLYLSVDCSFSTHFRSNWFVFDIP